jgi:hypothetical protein
MEILLSIFLQEARIARAPRKPPEGHLDDPNPFVDC